MNKLSSLFYKPRKVKITLLWREFGNALAMYVLVYHVGYLEVHLFYTARTPFSLMDRLVI